MKHPSSIPDGVLTAAKIDPNVPYHTTFSFDSTGIAHGIFYGLTTSMN